MGCDGCWTSCPFQNIEVVQEIATELGWKFLNTDEWWLSKEAISALQEKWIKNCPACIASVLTSST